jgi:hypothetical protein
VLREAVVEALLANSLNKTRMEVMPKSFESFYLSIANESGALGDVHINGFLKSRKFRTYVAEEIEVTKAVHLNNAFDS